MSKPYPRPELSTERAGSPTESPSRVRGRRFSPCVGPLGETFTRSIPLCRRGARTTLPSHLTFLVSELMRRLRSGFLISCGRQEESLASACCLKLFWLLRLRRDIYATSFRAGGCAISAARWLMPVSAMDVSFSSAAFSSSSVCSSRPAASSCPIALAQAINDP
jgi:hypothetical protein